MRGRGVDHRAPALLNNRKRLVGCARGIGGLREERPHGGNDLVRDHHHRLRLALEGGLDLRRQLVVRLRFAVLNDVADALFVPAGWEPVRLAGGAITSATSCSRTPCRWMWSSPGPAIPEAGAAGDPENANEPDEAVARTESTSQDDAREAEVARHHPVPKGSNAGRQQTRAPGPESCTWMRFEMPDRIPTYSHAICRLPGAAPDSKRQRLREHNVPVTIGKSTSQDREDTKATLSFLYLS